MFYYKSTIYMLWVPPTQFEQYTSTEQYTALLRVAEKLANRQAMASYVVSYLQLDISHSSAVLNILYQSLYQFFHQAKQEFSQEMQKKQTLVIDHITHMQQIDEQTHTQAEQELLEQLDALEETG